MSPSLLGVASQFLGGEIYLFGSLVSDRETISDIDVLIVYDSEEGLAEVRSQLKALALCAPLDIIFMSRGEERFLNFIEKQRAKLVDEVCRS